VRRLEEYTLTCPKLANLGFPINSICVRFFGLGGGSLEPGQRQNIHQVLDPVRNFKPNVIFVHVGENDISRISPTKIMSCLFDFCDLLASIDSVKIIVVSQLLPFPVLATNKEFIDAFNVSLSSVGPDCINVYDAYCWKHRIGAHAVDASVHVFHRDGVHLTRLGMTRYMKSIRTAVGQAVKKVRSQLVSF